MKKYDKKSAIKIIVHAAKEYEEKFSRKIPVIVAGGIFDRADIDHALELGADGVQIASRFVATKECDASDAYKKAYLDAEEADIQIVQSPVGMPGRALRNTFIRNLETAREPVRKCYNCLEKCDPKNVPYCITKALIEAVKGNLDQGLIFCGSNVGRIHEMTTVHELMKELAHTGITMLVVTHEMGFAREVSNRVIFIDDGKIQEDEPPQELFSNPKHPRLKAFLSKML